MNAFYGSDMINYTNLIESLINIKKEFDFPVVAFFKENICSVIKSYQSYPSLYLENLFKKNSDSNLSL